MGSGKDPRQKSNLKSAAQNFVTKKEPLNVRLQRLLSQDKSSAQTILDILEAPRNSQNEIQKFLRGIVVRIQQENEASFKPAPRTKPPTTRPPTRPPPPPPTRPPPPPPTRPTPPPPTRPPPTRAS